MRPHRIGRRLTVGILSPHPVVLEQFERQVSRSGFRVLLQRLDSSLVVDLRRPPVLRTPVVVVDAAAQRIANEALVASILDRHPAARLLVVAETFGEADAFALLRLGVKGLLTYREAQKQIRQALSLVAAGGLWVPRSILSRFVESILKRVRARTAYAHSLSRREQEALEGLLEGLSNKEIANKLRVSERTVKFHVSNVLSKFGVRRRADLILLSYQRQRFAA